MKNNRTLCAGLFALSLMANAIAKQSTSADTLIVFDSRPSGSVLDISQEKILFAADLSWDELKKIAADTTFPTLAYLDIAAIKDDREALETASEVFRSGVPVLLKMGHSTPERAKLVSKIFGISGPFGYAVFHRDRNSEVQIYRLEGDDEQNIMVSARLLLAELRLKAEAGPIENELIGLPRVMLNVQGPPQEGPIFNEFSPLPRVMYNIQNPPQETPPFDQFVGLPKLTYNINMQSPTKEMTSVVNIDVIRSAARSQDRKFVSIKTSATTIRTAKNGITIGGFESGGTKRNLWGAYLPHAYRFTHGLTATNITPILVDSAPASDARTDFSFTETKTTGFSIGGTLGTEFGASKDANVTYAAKSPFNVNFGFNYSHSKMLSYMFKDYLLQASLNGSKMTWNVPIDSKLRGALIERLTHRLPKLTEDKMTPMMRSASLESYSLWELPGTYTGEAIVSIGGGYDLSRSEWWWDRARLRNRHVMDTYDDEQTFILDMNSPFLTREMTVLIRSADGIGRCIAENADFSISLQACAPSDPRHQWGLDSESRYVNRATNRCLSVRETDGAMITNRCALDNRQQWEWQADRLHSLYNAEWRLYSEGRRLKLIPDGSMHFQNTPKNPFNPLNIPWASYPLAPSSEDVVPNHLAASPRISPDWVERYRGVDRRQRWRIEILRDGM